MQASFRTYTIVIYVSLALVMQEERKGVDSALHAELLIVESVATAWTRRRLGALDVLNKAAYGGGAMVALLQTRLQLLQSKTVQ